MSGCRLPSLKNSNVFWATEGTQFHPSERPLPVTGWYHWDETGQLGGGPYVTEDAAIIALNLYVEWLCDYEPR